MPKSAAEERRKRYRKREKQVIRWLKKKET